VQKEDCEEMGKRRLRRLRWVAETNSLWASAAGCGHTPTQAQTQRATVPGTRGAAGSAAAARNSLCTAVRLAHRQPPSDTPPDDVLPQAGRPLVRQGRSLSRCRCRASRGHPGMRPLLARPFHRSGASYTPPTAQAAWGEGQQRAQLVRLISSAVLLPRFFWQHVAKLLSDMHSASLNSLRPHHHRRHSSTRSTFHWPAVAWVIAPQDRTRANLRGWIAFSCPSVHHGRRSKSRSINGQGILSTRPSILTRHQTGITTGALERSSRLP
jgi:hypothetical protein